MKAPVNIPPTIKLKCYIYIYTCYCINFRDIIPETIDNIWIVPKHLKAGSQYDAQYDARPCIALVCWIVKMYASFNAVRRNIT